MFLVCISLGGTVTCQEKDIGLLSKVEPLVILALSPTNNALLQAWQGVGKGALCPLSLKHGDWA